jgi:tetrapyrrole methylase family protein/MazG family protein
MTRIKTGKNPHTLEARKKFGELVDIVHTLRSEGGCPWDRAQSLKDLKQYVLEEAYEVVQGLDHEDEKSMAEELGDLMFQVVFLAQMMQERGSFTLVDVLDHLVKKMIGRHPHVFGDVRAKTAEEALDSWESVKSREASAGSGRNKMVLEGVPLALPALLQAHLISKKVVRVGFEWDTEDDVWKKLDEELREFRQASTVAEKEVEMGDVLFTLVNIARKNGLNAEDALRVSNAKFRERFNELERRLLEQNRTFDQVTLREMDRIWDAIKQEEKGEETRRS